MTGYCKIKEINYGTVIELISNLKVKFKQMGTTVIYNGKMQSHELKVWSSYL